MKRWLFLSCAIVLFSCNEKKEIVPATSETASVADVKTASISIPSYDFSELEPLLHKDTDTTYVINFWATWCKPCVKELPYFEAITSNYSEEKVKVILVSLDFPEKLSTHVIPFVKENKLASQVVLLNDDDANTWIPKVSEEWGGAIPATLIYRNDIRKFHEGSMTLEELETEIQSIL